MSSFNLANGSYFGFGMLVALALIAVSGCVPVNESGLGRQVELDAVAPAATDEPRLRFQCPLRHIYVCERRLDARDNCYCRAEPTILQPAPEGLRTF